jgi:hypothetical protein
MPRFHRTRKPYTDEITLVEFTAEEEVIADAADLAQIRSKRNQLLAETDWWGASDNTMSNAQRDYRQMLRDITKTNTIYTDVDWGTKPE